MKSCGVRVDQRRTHKHICIHFPSNKIMFRVILPFLFPEHNSPRRTEIGNLSLFAFARGWRRDATRKKVGKKYTMRRTILLTMLMPHCLRRIEYAFYTHTHTHKVFYYIYYNGRYNSLTQFYRRNVYCFYTLLAPPLAPIRYSYTLLNSHFRVIHIQRRLKFSSPF